MVTSRGLKKFGATFVRRLPVAERRSGERSRLQSSQDLDVVFHVGAPKTGTSAIQYFLHANTLKLAKLGYHYPDHEFDRNRISGGHSEFGRLLIHGDLERARAWLESQLRVARKNNSVLLISAESLFDHSQLLSQAADGYRSSIVAFYRHPLESLISSYNQAVKRHFATRRLEHYLRQALQRNDHFISGQALDEWARWFGSDRVATAQYDSGRFENNRLELRFLELLGVEDAHWGDFELPACRVNGAYTLSALELKRLINQVLDKEDLSVSREIDWCLQEYSDASGEPRPPLRAIVAPELYDALVKKYQLDGGHIGGERNARESGIEATSDLGGNCIASQRQYSLGHVMHTAFASRPDVVDYLRARVKKTLANGQRSYDLAQLADVCGLDPEVFVPERAFQRGQVNVVCSEKIELADALREVAISLERVGQFEDALRVISRALALRPHGPVIIEIHDRLSKHLDTDSRRHPR